MTDKIQSNMYLENRILKRKYRKISDIRACESKEEQEEDRREENEPRNRRKTRSREVQRYAPLRRSTRPPAVSREEGEAVMPGQASKSTGRMPWH